MHEVHHFGLPFLGQVLLRNLAGHLPRCGGKSTHDLDGVSREALLIEVVQPKLREFFKGLEIAEVKVRDSS